MSINTYLRAFVKGRRWSIFPGYPRMVTVFLVSIGLLLGHMGWAQVVNGYAFAAQVGAYTSLGSGATRVAALENDEAVVEHVPLGFIFVANGRYYSEVGVSSNGWLGVGLYASPLPDPSGYPYIHSNAPLTIAPLWADLSGTGGTASYQTTGAAPNRVFTFEWRDWRWDRQATQPVISFQVRLYEGSNRVELLYENGPGAVSQATPAARAIAGLLWETTGLSGLPLQRTVLPNALSTNPQLNQQPQPAILARPTTGQRYQFTPSPNTLPPCPATVAPLISPIRLDNARAGYGRNYDAGGIYKVHYGPRGFVLGSAADQIALGTPADSAHLTGLLPDTEYEALVELECAPGAGPARSPRTLFRTIPRPSNDEATRAIWLPVLSNLNLDNVLAGTVKYATASHSAPLAACGSTPALPAGGHRDVWYVFRATSTAHLVAVVNTTTRFVLELRNGSGPSSVALSCMRTTAIGGRDTLTVTGLQVGRAYYVRLYPTTPYVESNSVIDLFHITVATVAPAAPANTNCAQATPVPVASYPGTAISGTMAGARAGNRLQGARDGSCSLALGILPQEVWYQFVSPGPTVLVSLEPDFDGVVEWHRACYSAPTWPASCCTAAAGRRASMAVNGLTAGTTYWLRVYRRSEYQNDDHPTFKLTVSMPATAPANDECAQSVVLPLTPRGQVGASGTLAGASSSGIVPATNCTLLLGSISTLAPPPVPVVAQDVWYHFVATAPTHALTLNAGTDALAEVFATTASGLSPCAAGAGGLLRLGCMQAKSEDWANTSQRLPGRMLLTSLAVGQTYWVRVYGTAGSTPALANGNPEFELSLHTWDAPANDNAAQAMPLQLSASAEPCTTGVSFTFDGATPSLPPTGSTNPERDVWFSFVAPPATAPATSSAVYVRFNFSSPLLQGGIEIRDGPGASAGIVTRSTTSPSMRLVGMAGIGSGNIVPGNTYYIRLYSSLLAPESCSDFTLCVTPLISNDEPCGAINLPVGPGSGQCQGTVRGTTYGAGTTRATTGGQLVPIGNCANEGILRDVWYRVVPPGPAFTLHCDDLILDLARLYVPTTAAGCAGKLRLVNCQTSTIYGGSGLRPLGTILFDSLMPGQTYYLAVSSRFGSYASLTPEFTLCAEQAQALPGRSAAVGARAALWPNPVAAGQLLHVQLSAPALPTNALISVQWLTVMGQTVAVPATPLQRAADGTLEVATAGLPRGMYIVRLWQADSRQPLLLRRVVIE